MLPSSTDLTDRQREVYDYLRKFWQENSFPPTCRDIVEHFGFSGPTAAVCHLKALAKKGYIELTPKLSRGIRFTTMPEKQGIPFFPSLRALSDALQA